MIPKQIFLCVCEVKALSVRGRIAKDDAENQAKVREALKDHIKECVLYSEVTGKTLKAFKRRIICSDLSFRKVSLTCIWEIDRKRQHRKSRDQLVSYSNPRKDHDSLGESSGSGDKYKQINLKSIWFRS